MSIDSDEQTSQATNAAAVESRLNVRKLAAFANLQLRELAVRDPLIGLFNRRSMEETLDR